MRTVGLVSKRRRKAARASRACVSISMFAVDLCHVSALFGPEKGNCRLRSQCNTSGR